MRLFHVSEDGGIGNFEPRLVDREVCGLLGRSVVWALDEAHLANYLFPRDCPRLCFRAGENTSTQDLDRFLNGDSGRLVAVLESAWVEVLEKTILYLYEFEARDFWLVDEVAGYWVTDTICQPRNVMVLNNLLRALQERGVELRFEDELWELREAVIASSLDYSLIRMRNARPPRDESGRFTPLPA